eukprot:CAMPEP_0182524722 /NCGR_PEP_ID=MMETSP1323-20130603/1985_1 /TAXON_ID=236787 /ORGANISM="Florenciella parvula, Strain RCC1693" /LENGTH=54 /DNA_ID=CAMNT_0024733339 /DNA_START=103 /DNA_END=264 /DNA_ORIENTATION=+
MNHRSASAGGGASTLDHWFTVRMRKRRRGDGLRLAAATRNGMGRGKAEFWATFT